MCVVASSLCLLAPAFPASAQAPPPPPASAPAPPLAPASRPPVEVTGATVIEYDAQTQRYTFRGAPVVIVRGLQRLEAPEILYDAAARRATLLRRGTILTPTMEMSANQITADLAARHIVADGEVTGRFLDNDTWTSVSAGRIEADDRPDLQRAEATGDVVVVRPGEEVRGDHLVYDRLTRHGLLDGHAVLTRGTDHLHADRLTVDLGTDDAEATGNVLLERESQGIRGSADLATYSRREQTAVLSGHAQLTRGKDTLTADRITMDLARNVANAEGQPRIVASPPDQTPGTPP
jgi:lipopolysaccharide export system protein LptA